MSDMSWGIILGWATAICGRMFWMARMAERQVSERTITVTVDVAPEGDGPEFEDWCERHGGYLLNGSRRAWLDPYKTYLRDAVGIAETRTGERFLVSEEDFDE